MAKPEQPYNLGDAKISKKEWDDLNAFFVSIQPPAQNELYASGDHYMLLQKLRKLGFKPKNSDDAFVVYSFAERVILAGWDK